MDTPRHELEPVCANTVAPETRRTSSAFQLTPAVVGDLEQRERELRDFLENADVPLHWGGEDGTILWANAAELSLLGYSREQYIGHNINEFHVDEPVIRDILLRLKNNQELHKCEARLRCKDGTIRYVVINSSVYREEGRFVHTRCVTLDITEQRRASEVLERLSSIVESSDDAIITNDLNGIIRSWNRGAERTFGYKADEIIGKHSSTLAAPDRVDETSNILERLVRGERVDHYETKRKTKDGRILTVSLTVSPIRDGSGRIVGVSKVARDVTEGKRAEETLRRSEAYLADAQRLTHTGSWAWSAFTQAVVHWSEEMFRIWGFDPHGGPPDSETQWQRIHPEDFKTLLQEKIEKAISGDLKTDTAEEYRIGLPDGTVKYIHATSHPVFDDSGKVIEYIGANVDVTERKRAEEALHRSEAYLSAAQRLTHTGSWAWDPRTEKLLYWSEEMFRIFGLDPRQGLPAMETFWDRVHPEDRDSEYELMWNSVQAKTEYEHEHRIVLPDGTVKHIQGIGHPVLNASGEVVEVVGTRVDITERKRADEEHEQLRQLEAELAHINRVSMMGELAASIAHEVNQPLSGIVSNGGACLRWLGVDPPNIKEVREALGDIVRDGKRAGEVIARIRALTKRTAPPKEKLDPNETIREVVAMVRDEAKRTSVVIQTRLADDLSPVCGDRVQLQQVMLNLIMNGIQAMSSVGERARELVITTCNIDPDQVKVTVLDSGTGLDLNTIARIFDPFYTTKADGMGMGLSISRSIVQHHGGKLWATANDGPGTTFHFSLPKHHAGASDARTAAV